MFFWVTLQLVHNQGFANALRWVKEMKETEEDLSDRLSYLAGFVSAFRDQIHTDIQVKPGTGGPSIPAHRALLVIFNLLDPLFSIETRKTF